MASEPIATPSRGGRLRELSPSLVLAALVATATLLTIAASTLLTVAFTDYEEEALPSVGALTKGDFGGFLDRLPTYGGSLILRAPAALLVNVAGGGELAVYRALAVPCLLAGAIFGLMLFSRLSTGRRGGAAAWIALLVVVANPVLLPALDTGHPEEYLGAVLCAAGVAAAFYDRPGLAGLLIGAAGANKAWAVLAVVPALIALRHGRLRFVLVTGVLCTLVLAPAILAGTQAVASAGAVASQTGTIFQPWQWTWFTGGHDGVVRGLYAQKPEYRTAPGWLGTVGHLPVIVIPLLLAGLAAVRRVRREDALLLLAGVFLLRCVIDPWDTAYYHLPFLMALAAHEVVARQRAPLAAAAASCVVYGSMVMSRDVVSPDVQAALFLLWSVPTVMCLTTALLWPARWTAFSAGAGARVEAAAPSLARLVATEPPAPDQVTTVSSFGSPFSTSCPSSVTITRSSIRTPTAPGT